MRRRDQLGSARRIDAIETRRNGRRAADAHVHFLCAGGLHHLHDLAARRAAYQRIVYKDDAPAFENAADGVQLHTHAEMANRLLWLDEGAAYVVIADEPDAHWNIRLLCESDRGTHTGVRDRDNDIRVHRFFTGQQTSKIRADLVDAFAEHVAVGTREIHVLEDTLRRRRGRERLERLHAACTDDHDLARLDVPDIRGANQIERAGFRAHDHGATKPAEGQRTEPMRI